MDNRFSRTELLLGSSGMEKLKNARVALFGVGGVGGYAAEVLARSGIGTIDLIDNDTVSLSNINRQIIATEKTVGLYKTQAMKERILGINPDAVVNTHELFFMPDTELDFSVYNYIIDAIDTVTAKTEIIVRAKANKIPVISSMGTGNKLDPTQFEICDIYKTSVCPLARVMRKLLKERGIDSLKVLYSKETPVTPISSIEENGRHLPGSTAFAPSAAGIIIAAEVIKDLIKG